MPNKFWIAESDSMPKRYVAFVTVSASSVVSIEMSTVSTEGSATDDLIYREPSIRLLSFSSWPNSNVSKESLALAGFYYIGGVRGEGTDAVRCAYCGGELVNWVSGDTPLFEHLKHFPHCSFARDTLNRFSANTTGSQTLNEDLLFQNNASELGIRLNRPPVQPQYRTFSSRFETFSEWPETRVPKPEVLATAGFYFTGEDDMVKCFHCDIGLCRWEPTDDPWAEHAKHFSDCGYLLLMKGKKFVDDCSRTTGETNQERTQNSRINRTVTETDIENFMGSPCALVALHCGLQPARVRQAIRKRLQDTGVPFRSPTDLIDATLNEQLNETPFSIPETSSSDFVPSTSNRYSVDDAVVDQVTRMIINSALMEESLENQNLSVPVNDAGGELEDMMSRGLLIDNNQNNDEHDPDGEYFSDSSEESRNVNIENSHDVPENSRISEDKLTTTSENQISIISLANSNKNITLEEENKMLRDARTCKICMDTEVCVVFLPCGHLVSCLLCASGLSQCPICRTSIKGIVRTYLS